MRSRRDLTDDGGLRVPRRTLGVAGLLLLTFLPTRATTQQPTEPYEWNSVPIVGGGFVTGIVFHPTAPDVRYVRTDIGGAYRWDAAAERWRPLLDWLPYEDRNLMGIESLAVDPADPDRVYLAAGTYTAPEVPDGAVLRSADGGRTFRRADLPVKFGGNENGRGNGERMAVDPNDGRVLYLGPRHAGLWRSEDHGESWSPVSSFPDVREAPKDEAADLRGLRGGRGGVVAVLFDPASGVEGGRSAVIYAAASLKGRSNLFRSTDAGATWSAVPGQPVENRPTRMVLAGDGTLYLSYGSEPGPSPMHDGAVWKLNTRTGEWTDITPERPVPDGGRGFGYAAVAVDATDPTAILVSTFGRPGGEELYRSTDGGRTWAGLFHGDGAGARLDASAAPYVMATGIHWLFDVEIDPSDPDHAMFTTGYGGWETFDLTNADRGEPTTWTLFTPGIEETVALDLLAPPGPVQ
ncbi:MAG: WD40/YVTN/BNR-like repeat-containing protein, partial [Gemmatimonadota bacterium]